MIVGTASAVRMIWEERGILRSVSQMIRTGSLPPSMRQVSRGSSASTVPIPAMIPRYRWRKVWTWARAASPVIHLEAPV